MKRIFDILFSSLVLIFFLPFGLLIAIFIFLGSKGSAFYTQERVGQFGKPFKLLKFRTMKLNADKYGSLTVGMRDPRITKIGYFLRRSKLDEFPQFLNVLKGEMSVVGPRPEVQEYVNYYNNEQKKILNLKPGITDYASLEFFKENEILGASDDPQKTYIEIVMPKKIEINQRYLQNPTLAKDLKIIYMTFLKMLKM